MARGDVQIRALLLADVEGSSSLWEDGGAAMAEAMARYDDLVATSIDECGGRRPLEQGEGDSFVAVFARAADAVRCAAELQLALARTVWPTPRPLRVRMAIDVGEVEMLADGRCVGHAFNRCARIRELAHGGQVLVSSGARDVAIDDSPEVTFIDLGDHQLRGLDRAAHLHQLAHDIADQTFPALRTGSTTPHNLPVAHTTFVGRTSERDELEERLGGSPGVVTVVGSGGAGKTRFAAEVAWSMLDVFVDGIWWIELAPVTDDTNVGSTLAAILGLAIGPDEPVPDTIAAHLEDRHALVVLDNCEHVIEACAELTQTIGQRAPAVRIMATSRERLGVDGETTFDLPSLSLPPTDRVSVDEVRECEAVSLFLDRAVAVRSNFTLTDANADAVATICRRLDGIPLAIELAAARVRVLTPADLAASLNDRFRVLVGSSRAKVARQRTLEASVDWSVQLLAPEEQRVFERLSIFPGTFDLDAAEAVCGDDAIDARHVLDLLTSLVDKSLVVVEHGEHRTRYRMLETIRFYSRQRLADSPAAEAARDRHLSHFLSVAAQAAVGMRGPDQPSWKARLDLDLDNMRAAMAHALATGDPDAHLRLASALMDFWLLRSAFEEIQHSLADALEASTSDDAVRARALATIGWMMYMTADLRPAYDMADEGVALARRAGDDEALATALWVRGWVGSFLLEADGDLTEALDLASSLDAPSLRNRIENADGWVRSLGTDPVAGINVLASAIERADGEGDLDALGTGSYMLGTQLLFRGRVREADAVLEQALDANRAIGNSAYVAQTLGAMAADLAFGGSYVAARTFAADLDEAYEAVSSEYFQRQMGIFRAMSHLTEGRFDDAGVQLGDVEWWREREYIGMIAICQWLHGAADLAAARIGSARDRLEEAVEVAEGLRILRLLPLVQLVRLERRIGESERAEDLAHAGLREAVEIEASGPAADFFDHLSGIAADLESPEESARLRGAADRLREECGWARWQLWAAADDADVERLRRELGDNGYERIRAEGAALALDDAVAYAVRGRGERSRPSTGWASLTPTEDQVVALVAEGCSNAEVADRLFVSVNTVKTHLRHVFEKLGHSNRAEVAAAHARRRDHST